MNKLLEVQGDVALRPSALPSGAIKIKIRPLALGEVSGHAHVVTCKTSTEENPGFELFEHNGTTFIAVGSDGASLEHLVLKVGTKADHEPIVLQANTVYEVILQNEYNPESAAFERVLD